MRAARWWVLASVAAIGACGGDSTGPSGDIPAELVGTWEAGPDCHPQCYATLFSRNSADTLGFTSLLTVRMEVRSSGRLDLSVVGLGEDALVEGDLEVRQGKLIVSADGVADSLSYTVAGNQLTAQMLNSLQQDITGDGQPEEVGLRVKLFRQ